MGRRGGPPPCLGWTRTRRVPTRVMAAAVAGVAAVGQRLGRPPLPRPPPPLDAAAAAAVPAIVNTPLHGGYTVAGAPAPLLASPPPSTLLVEAARRADATAVSWLLSAGADPARGRPYLATSDRRVRAAFRVARAEEAPAGRWDWEAGGLGPPLSRADAAAADERERARRRKKAKAKAERAREARLDAADPGRRARELRAAAAERRLGLRQ